MATSSISGIASGLDTKKIIDQLMQLEAAPQDRLKVQQTREKAVLAALQSLNTDVSLLASRAETLAKASTWQTLKGTSTSGAFSVNVADGASAGSFTVTVDRLAAAHQLGFAQPAGLDDVVAVPANVRITGSDGTVHEISTGGGTLKELVSAINGATSTTGVQATTVRVDDGSYRLLVQSTKTGAGSQFTLTKSDGSELLGGASVQQGTDAKISLGLGITATSATNTFTDLVPGVSITLGNTAAVGSTGTVAITRDSASIKSSVKALVDQLNSLLTSIDAKSAGKKGSADAGVLVGDSTSRSLRDALAATIFTGDNRSMAAVGVQTDRYGKFVFDEAAFDKAYAADPARTAGYFTTAGTGGTDGWAGRLTAVAKKASNSGNGTITSAITGRNTSIDRLQDSIEAWDLRLEMRRTSLSRRYFALETALNTLQSQGNWLSSQLESLKSSSSS